MTERIPVQPTEHEFVREVAIVPEVITDEWMKWFSETYSARPEQSWQAVVTTEDWFEQPPDEVASSYYELNDRMSDVSTTWQRRIIGTVLDADATYLPDIGGGKQGAQPVIALYDASLLDKDGNKMLLAGGRLVLIRLAKLPDNDIELIRAS